jgi:hypothetical protein
MTIQEQIMAQRTQQGLKIVIEDAEGNQVTLYPKDQATKARWIAGYARKGMTILEQ